MPTLRDRALAHCRQTVALAAPALALAVLLAACGSTAKLASSTSAQVRRRACRQVEAALSDGPEPEADPVGYAEAQVLPLRGIHTADAKLERAIHDLASAYAAVSSSNGSRRANAAAHRASEEIDALCPGTGS